MPQRLTKEQELGTRFEIWTENLLKDNGYSFVRRNIVYHRSRYEFRQVDIDYREGFLWQTHTLVECKYSSQGKVKLEWRGPRGRKAGQLFNIETILDEVEERRQFVKARKAILLTNHYFTDEVYTEAGQYGHIEVKDSCWLRELDKKRLGLLELIRKRRPIEEQIRKVDLQKYELGTERVKV